ncbi:MAG: FAD:protein FMN transferase, partial [Rhodocyclaceae bacterium]|nr:FAD:protein FMN transferase [Rhodocyclaceae bacterium]
EVLRDFDYLHRTYHAWQPSELTTLNEALAEGRGLEVGEEMAGFLREAQALAARSEHLFDPGIGRLVQLWGFHDEEFKPVLPDPARLAELRRAGPGIARLRIEGRTVSAGSRAVALDFGGYLKGVALDRAAAILRRAGHANALVNIGGNVMALGSKGGTPWRVGIQHPRSPSPMATLELRDGEAIGTSGDYQRYFELDGRRYCHLIDPRSGVPATGTQAVSVLVPPGPAAGMRSDVASKPLFIAGDDWPRLARATGVSDVLRVAADGRIQVTAGFAARLKFDPPDLRTEVLP